MWANGEIRKDGQIMTNSLRDEHQLLNIDEAVELLSISRTQLYSLMSAGKLAFVKFGKSRRVPLAALLELIERHTHTTQRPRK
jgi:excisionase family DNA binding protein